MMVKSYFRKYEYRYRAQDIGSNKPSQIQRRNRSIFLERPASRMHVRLLAAVFRCFSYVRILVSQENPSQIILI
jgi:hypothetical protein